ncbi:hypothetical protein BC940DRAFT_263839 [Gongronella butleri]|nr:hypothetical protein BC940DRAFT_263839 [Gongronella butleri]
MATSAAAAPFLGMISRCHLRMSDTDEHGFLLHALKRAAASFLFFSHWISFSIIFMNPQTNFTQADFTAEPPKDKAGMRIIRAEKR